MSAETSATPEVDVEEGRRRLDRGALLLDVRTAEEWDAGHVDGSTWIPMAELVARRVELPADREVVVICRSGGRSTKATEALVRWGYDAVTVSGGAQAWVAAGHPLVRDDGSPGVVG